MYPSIHRSMDVNGLSNHLPRYVSLRFVLNCRRAYIQTLLTIHRMGPGTLTLRDGTWIPRETVPRYADIEYTILSSV